MVLRIGITAAALALLAGCMTMDEEAAAPGDDARFACSADRLGGLVGRQASTELGAEAMRASGARTIRWIQPGMAVTMDYRTDRLNIELDGANRVVALRCG
jgi:outer membrane biogenesis lipoprotein LolB